MSGRRAVILGLALVIAAVAYLATGCVVVAPGEVVIVHRLGRVLREPWVPGLHVGWPFGFDRIDRVRTGEVRDLRIGLARAAGVGEEPGAGEYLTGDLNLLRAQATVQYRDRVDDPVTYTRRAEPIEPLLARLAESSLSRALARQGIDATLRDGRAAVAREATEDLARTAERYGMSVSVLSVNLTDARPPSEVFADFASAQSARSEHDRRVNEAKTTAATTVTHAKARAQARVEQARGQAARTLALTKSRAGRFLALLAEAEKAYGLTVRRLYLETVRDLLPRVHRKLVLAPDEPLDLSILGAAAGR
jgi:membrane protease subunit HflK